MEASEDLVDEKNLEQRPDQASTVSAAEAGQHPERDLEQDVQQRERDKKVDQPGCGGAEEGESAGGEEYVHPGDQGQ
jgi:hypothetical protein